MKSVHFCIAVLTITASLSMPVLAVEIGGDAPEFDLPGRAGTVKLSDFKGKIVYLDFWASWCGPCRLSFPWMSEMQSRYGDKGLRVIGVNVDQKLENANSFLKEHPAGFDVLFDQAGKTPQSYEIKGMPTSLLIGPDGKVIMVHMGFKESQRNELERQIKVALNVKD
jgi:thiol-disulfide isomerase/thioredoxin